MAVTKEEGLSHTAEDERKRREVADTRAYPPDNLHATTHREMPTLTHTAMQSDTYDAGRTTVDHDEVMEDPLALADEPAPLPDDERDDPLYETEDPPPPPAPSLFPHFNFNIDVPMVIVIVILAAAAIALLKRR